MIRKLFKIIIKIEKENIKIKKVNKKQNMKKRIMYLNRRKFIKISKDKI